jgi:hypothetical protein
MFMRYDGLPICHNDLPVYQDGFFIYKEGLPIFNIVSNFSRLFPIFQDCFQFFKFVFQFFKCAKKNYSLGPINCPLQVLDPSLNVCNGRAAWSSCSYYSTYWHGLFWFAIPGFEPSTFGSVSSNPVFYH